MLVYSHAHVFDFVWEHYIYVSRRAPVGLILTKCLHDKTAGLNACVYTLSDHYVISASCSTAQAFFLRLTQFNTKFAHLLIICMCCRQGKFAHAAHFVLRCGRQPSSGSYQTPVVALACNFEQPPNGCISYTSALTLFHEFGHALHSLLSKTKYQHMSGMHVLCSA